MLAGAAGLGLRSAGTASAQAPRDDEPGLHDLTPEFWRFYDANPPDVVAPGERVRALLQPVFDANADIYRSAGFGPKAAHGLIDPEAVTAWLAVFDPLASAARRLSESFPSAWRAHAARFAAQFPRAERMVRVYGLMSLCAFDLEDRNRHGRPCLFVGVDGVALLDGPGADMAALLDQQGFRRYQAQANPSLWPSTTAPLWTCIWREGLASYAASKLNPDLGRAAVLMDAGLANLAPERVRQLAADLVPALETTDPAHRARFLSAAGQASEAAGDMPARSGYLLGYLLAEHAGRSLSLDALARLPAPKAHLFVKHQLSVIAHG